MASRKKENESLHRVTPKYTLYETHARRRIFIYFELSLGISHASNYGTDRTFWI